ncbi:glycosyltransferase family 4 protein [Candidatus Parcubacteria bacterium]|nr:glycosyltransferase family 4 protein [Candidatus Parcubacteria bacterium]
MKNILVVTGIYPPEINSASHLMQEFAEGLAKRGHNVWVLTSYPKHYVPKEAANQIFETFSEKNNVKIIRAKTLPLRKVSFFVRGIAQLIMPFSFFSAAKKYITGPIDTVVVYSPPLPMAYVGSMIKKRYGAQFILLLEDIFPQIAIDLNILTGWKYKPIVAFFEWMEKKIYAHADKITFHSEGGRQFLIEKKGIPNEKIVAISNWVDIDIYQNLKEDLSFRKRWLLQDKFIFVFAGILGPAQGAEFMIEVAKGVSDIKEIIFLLVVDGMQKPKIEELVRRYGLTNVVLKSFIPKEEYPYLVRDIDVGLVCLSAQNKTPFIPGKFLGYMAAGKPIVAFLNKESDGFELVRKAGCGYAVVSTDLPAAIAAVKKIYSEKANLAALGAGGFAYAKNNLGLDVCLEKFEKLFNQ